MLKVVLQFVKNSKSKFGWSVGALFVIGLHQKDITVLRLLKEYFNGVGNLSVGKDGVWYAVGSLQDLTNVIIPHFLKYPLITKKKADFILLKNVVDLMNRKEHLTLEGLQKIVAIKASMNRGWPEELKKAFPDVQAVERPLIESQKVNNPYWLAGFASGEGCFQVNNFKSATKIGETVKLTFTITQHSKDKELMASLVEFLGGGNIYVSNTAVDYKISKINDLIEKVIPFFDKYNILGTKALDFQDFKKVALLMKNRDHLTGEGRDSICEIKANMNKGMRSVRSHRS